MSWHSAKSSIHFVEKIVYCHIAGSVGRVAQIYSRLCRKIKEVVVVYPHIFCHNSAPSGYSTIANTYGKARLKHEEISINIHAIGMKHNTAGAVEIRDNIIGKDYVFYCLRRKICAPPDCRPFSMLARRAFKITSVNVLK